MIRKSFFVKPGLLFKYVFYALISVMITSVCVFAVMKLTVGGSEALENINNAEIAKLQAVMMTEFWWIVVILVVVIGIQSVLTFHRVVGPIYAFEKIIRQMKTGRLVGHFHVRNKDEFKELASLVESMSLSFAEYIKKDRKIIAGIKEKIEVLETKASSDEEKTELKEIKNRLSEITSNFIVNVNE